MPKCTQILKTIGKTINLAKPQVYQVPRKPPLNSLVFEKLPEPKCGDRIASNTNATPKPVRICTKEELQAMYCCPCLCDCKVKCQMTFAQKLAKALILLAKSAIVGALIYYTWAEGLWSDSEHSYLIVFAGKVLIIGTLVKYTWKEGLWSDSFHSACFIGKYIKETCPEQPEEELNEFADMKDQEFPPASIEPCFPYIPRSDFLMYQAAYVWNKTILLAFWTVMEGPFALWAYLLDLFKPPPPQPPEPCDQIRSIIRNN